MDDQPTSSAAEGRASPVTRISISMPEDLLTDLDDMVAARGFESRSQAIATMINEQLLEHKRQLGQQVMVGTITLFYDRSVRGLQKQLADLQCEHIDEVISSLHVHLAQNQMMEVVLVQGPAAKLQAIANEMITQRGVVTGRLQLMAATIPPLHPLPGAGA
ncbi:nickel-responsive transcriptional regulator NikR [Aquabacterium sp.]|jgi:CopG family nickel-responsive transcriptional regulator|uniref:nickel-responsive transcriptional regulator NikR n=1 Tax=Aquabacterium sp. TaxID=1872578 RepID=UPI0025C696DD|nr:nickel-responsive transcriptional regulator NikR [Aquabacterium sp.]